MNKNKIIFALVALMATFLTIAGASAVTYIEDFEDSTFTAPFLRGQTPVGVSVDYSQTYAHAVTNGGGYYASVLVNTSEFMTKSYRFTQVYRLPDFHHHHIFIGFMGVSSADLNGFDAIPHMVRFHVSRENIEIFKNNATNAYYWDETADQWTTAYDSYPILYSFYDWYNVTIDWDNTGMRIRVYDSNYVLKYNEFFTAEQLEIPPTPYIQISSGWLYTSGGATMDFETATYTVASDLIVDYSDFYTLNNTVQNSNVTMTFDITEGTGVNCSLDVNGTIEDSTIVAVPGAGSLTYAIKGTEPEENLPFMISCDDGSNVVNSSVVYMLFSSSPIINVYSPQNQSLHYKPDGLVIDIDMLSATPNKTSLLLYDKNNVLKYNDTNLNPSATESYSYTINATDLVTGNMRLELSNTDDSLNETALTYTVGITDCVEEDEVWVEQYTDCDPKTDTRVKYYTDSNSCGSTIELPADNGTVIECPKYIQGALQLKQLIDLEINDTSDISNWFSQYGYATHLITRTNSIKGMYSLQFEAEPPNHYLSYLNTTPITNGNAYLSFYVKGYNSPQYVAFGLQDENGNGANVQFSTVGWTGSNQMMYHTTGVNVLCSNCYYNDTVYRVEINLSLATDTYDLYIDGVLVGDDLQFRYPSTDMTQVTRVMIYSTEEHSVNEFDNICISNDGFCRETPELSWDNLPLYDGAVYSQDAVMEYDILNGTTPMDCFLEVNGTIVDNESGLSLGSHSLTYTVLGNESGNYLFQIGCSNSVTTGYTSQKTIEFDFSNPVITSYSPYDESYHYITDGLPINVEFLNDNLVKTVIELYQSNGTLKFNDTNAVNTTNATYTYTINSTELVLGDEMRLHLYALDNASNEADLNISVRIVNCAEEAESWSPQYSACNILDNKTLTYTDSNSCGTTFDLPADNGTIESCNYCDSTYNYTATECVYNLQNVSYYYTNTCCADTNLTSDCNLPDNETDVRCEEGICGVTSIRTEGKGGNEEWVYSNDCLELRMRKNNYIPVTRVTNKLDGKTFNLMAYGIEERDANTSGKREWTFASMKFSSIIEDDYVVYYNPQMTFGYKLVDQQFKSVLNLTHYDYFYDESDLWLKMSLKRGADKDVIYFIAPVVDGVSTSVEIENESKGVVEFISQKLGRGTEIFLDPIYSPCEENWVANYTSCNITDQRIKTYYDSNACGSTLELPLDNGTTVTCNYCSATYDINLTEVCDDTFHQTRYYTLNNEGSCCNVTNITADCTVPSNETVGCAGVHEATDVTGLVVDGISEFGITIVGLALLIGTISVLAFIVKMVM